MDNEIEEMVSTGLVKPIKIRGTAQAVFRMIQVLAQYKIYGFSEELFNRWAQDKPVEDFTEQHWDTLPKPIISIN